MSVKPVEIQNSEHASWLEMKPGLDREEHPWRFRKGGLHPPYRSKALCRRVRLITANQLLKPHSLHCPGGPHRHEPDQIPRHQLLAVISIDAKVTYLRTFIAKHDRQLMFSARPPRHLHMLQPRHSRLVSRLNTHERVTLDTLSVEHHAEDPTSAPRLHGLRGTETNDR